MTYLLDTETCIGVLWQRPGMVRRLSQLAPTDCAISMISVYELFCGVEKAQNPATERQQVERFISAVIELPLDRVAAKKGHEFALIWNGQVNPSALTICPSQDKRSRVVWHS